jgi:hypothetical protein
MSCELCGGGDMWIKACRTPEGCRLLVYDDCYGEHTSVLVIVPGDRVVMARCCAKASASMPSGTRVKLTLSRRWTSKQSR